MANGKETTEEKDVLDDIKKVEQNIRRRALAEVMVELKYKAHDILKLKEETLSLLEALGIKDDDIKRVVDFVNSLDEVQLSDADKKAIRDLMRTKAKNQKQQIAKKAVTEPYYFVYNSDAKLGQQIFGSAYTTTGGQLNATSTENVVDAFCGTVK